MNSANGMEFGSRKEQLQYELRLTVRISVNGIEFGCLYGTVAVRDSVNCTERLRCGMDLVNGTNFV